MNIYLLLPMSAIFDIKCQRKKHSLANYIVILTSLLVRMMCYHLTVMIETVNSSRALFGLVNRTDNEFVDMCY